MNVQAQLIHKKSAYFAHLIDAYVIRAFEHAYPGI